MGSSTEKKKYPPRLYPEGKSPIMNRSMNHNCSLGTLRRQVRDGIGDDVYAHIANTCSVGVILKLVDSSYVWASKTVHHLLTRQLEIENKHEIWSLIGGRPVRFSLHEFSDITGLNCEPFDVGDDWDIDHTEFWGEMGVKIGDGPNFSEMRNVLRRCKSWSFEKRKMVGLLWILSVGILGISRGSRIPLKYAKRVLDPEAFERYPWGRVGFQSLVDSIKIVSYIGNTYYLRGCVHVLLIWGYESVQALGETFGNRKQVDEVPLLRWNSCRKRFNFEHLLLEDKKVHSKVRVRHLLEKPAEEIYPVWVDGNEDEKLDNMLQDIIHGRLDETAWDKAEVRDVKEKKQKRKKVLEESGDAFVDKLDVQTSKKKRETSRKREKKTAKESDKENKAHGQVVEDDGCENVNNNEFSVEMAMGGVMTLLKSLTEKVEAMNTNTASAEARLEAKFEARFASIETRLAEMEKGTKQRFLDVVAGNSNANVDDEADSRTELLMLETNATSEEVLQVTCNGDSTVKRITPDGAPSKNNNKLALSLEKQLTSGRLAKRLEKKRSSESGCVVKNYKKKQGKLPIARDTDINGVVDFMISLAKSTLAMEEECEGETEQSAY